MVSLELLVVLAPAIASAFAGFCVEVVPRLRSAYRRFMRSVERVEWQRDEEGA